MKKKKKVALCVVLGIGFFLVFFNKIDNFLSLKDSLEKTDVVVSISGNPNRLNLAYRLYNAGYAKKIIITNPLDYNQVKNRFLLDPLDILKPNWVPESTYQDVMAALSIMENKGYRSAIIVSDVYHMYRISWSFYNQTSNEKYQLLFYPSYPYWYVGDKWWYSPESVSTIALECMKVVYYWVVHGIFGLEGDPIDVKIKGNIYNSIKGYWE